MTFPRHARIGSDQVEDRDPLIMVSFRMNDTEQSHAFLNNADNVIFRR